MKLKYCLLVLLSALLTTSVRSQGTRIKGQVVNAGGAAVAGASVLGDHGNKVVVTDLNGVFEIVVNRLPDTLQVNHVSYRSMIHVVSSSTLQYITLQEAVSELDEALVIAYGKTTRRLATGSVSKLAAKEIALQPVSNLLTALAGRVPGVTVTQTSGVPGSMVKIEVRGRSSIQQGTEPLYIIDGVPFAAGNQPVNRLSSVLAGEQGSGLSPMSTIAPSEIESIEILKDADATAIYGSRGANGVVLITTKKGKGERTRLNIFVNTGVSSVTRSMAMLNTAQYVQMRREAFANDGLAMTNSNAPDLLLWDTTKYTDMKKYFLCGNAENTEAAFSLTGGGGSTRFIIGGSYR
ncbi:MAG TPA: TonB-dependent receptor plug domain-containing protein, partial [Chitinophagaceae bacterium]